MNVLQESKINSYFEYKCRYKITVEWCAHQKEFIGKEKCRCIQKVISFMWLFFCAEISVSADIQIVLNWKWWISREMHSVQHNWVYHKCRYFLRDFPLIKKEKIKINRSNLSFDSRPTTPNQALLLILLLDFSLSIFTLKMFHSRLCLSWHRHFPIETSDRTNHCNALNAVCSLWFEAFK